MSLTPWHVSQNPPGQQDLPNSLAGTEAFPPPSQKPLVHTTQPPLPQEPLFLPKLQSHFADFPYIHYAQN